MARRSPVATADSFTNTPLRSAGVLGAFRQILTAIVILAGIISAIWFYLTVDNFLATDSRFHLVGPPEPGERSEFFRIEGIRNVTDEQVIQIFARDFGRSIFLCPLKERRLKLLGIDWVRDVSISRLWPDRLVVRIMERTPAAAVQLPASDGTMLLSFVDPDGVLLDPQRLRPSRLPVLTGITRTETEASRRERMKRFLRLQAELGSHVDKISEIDVSNLDNLKVIQQFDDRALTLILGNQNYRERYENFLDNQADIRRRLPDAITLDLRQSDRIIAVGSPSNLGTRAVPHIAPRVAPRGNPRGDPRGNQ